MQQKPSRERGLWKLSFVLVVPPGQAHQQWGCGQVCVALACVQWMVCRLQAACAFPLWASLTLFSVGRNWRRGRAAFGLFSGKEDSDLNSAQSCWLSQVWSWQHQRKMGYFQRRQRNPCKTSVNDTRLARFCSLHMSNRDLYWAPWEAKVCQSWGECFFSAALAQWGTSGKPSWVSCLPAPCLTYSPLARADAQPRVGKFSWCVGWGFHSGKTCKLSFREKEWGWEEETARLSLRYWIAQLALPRPRLSVVWISAQHGIKFVS